MVGLEQLDRWRAQLNDEAPSYARDLAHALLREIERLHASELVCERRFASTQATLIRDQLAAQTECSACNDIALRRMGERMTFFPTSPNRAAPSALVSSIATGRRI